MPQIISDKNVFTLLEVTQSIQKTLAERYRSSFWVKAEMNKLNHYTHSGHCYPELVEKKEGKVIAQLKANIWKSDFERINARFLAVLKEPVKDGITILFYAQIIFDSSHGLSLRITDIDPSFSLGELEREKRDTIEKLQQEGIFNNNKRLKFPLLPQRIAVISVETSKGYADYVKVITQNPWHYKFFNVLFPSILQGERSVASILYQMKRIRKVIKHFDVVVIIRGGGGDVGLSSYNNYELAREIALFPIPVITGIGHSTNETVSEMVSFKNAITPTELADLLIQAFHNFSIPVKHAGDVIIDRSKRILRDEKLKLRNTIKYFQSVTNNQLLKSNNDIQRHYRTLIQQSKFILRQETQSFELITQNIKKLPFKVLLYNNQSIKQANADLKLHVTVFIQQKKLAIQSLDKNVNILDPINILRRGFTITLNNGKAIRDHSSVKAGDTITTVLADGQLVSEVRSVKKSD